MRWQGASALRVTWHSSWMATAAGPKRMLPVSAGHVAGARRVRGVVEACAERGVTHVTLFAFSTENWQRPMQEVASLMRLFERYLRSQIKALNEHGVRLRVVGDRSRFSPILQCLIEHAEASTLTMTGLTLMVAANYGGRWDVLQAVRRLAQERGIDALRELDEAGLQPWLSTADAPPVDLMVRTGGECRISNFLLWQAAYAELYFTDVLWPDFCVRHLDEALQWYARRDRRFGGDRAAGEARPAAAPLAGA